MLILILGLALWSAVHLAPVMAVERRASLVARFGAGPYKIAAALLLVLSVVLMAQGYKAAGAAPVYLWFAPPWMVHLNNLLMLLAFLVFGAGHAKASLRRVIRHPQLTGVKIWALAHLLVNGDLRSALLFGGLLAWAVATVVMTNRRDGPWVRPPESPRSRDLLHVGLSIALFGAVALVHNWLGVWPFPG